MIVDHPDLQPVRRRLLVTRHAHDRYRRFGFESLREPELLMERPGALEDR
jgi:predicted N-acetyltransferase YhbS